MKQDILLAIILCVMAVFAFAAFFSKAKKDLNKPEIDLDPWQEMREMRDKIEEHIR